MSTNFCKYTNKTLTCKTIGCNLIIKHTILDTKNFEIWEICSSCAKRYKATNAAVPNKGRFVIKDIKHD